MFDVKFDDMTFRKNYFSYKKFKKKRILDKTLDTLHVDPLFFVMNKSEDITLINNNVNVQSLNIWTYFYILTIALTLFWGEFDLILIEYKIWILQNTKKTPETPPPPVIAQNVCTMG